MKIKNLFCISIVCVLTIGIGSMTWYQTVNVSKLEQEGKVLEEERVRLSGLLDKSKAEYQVLTDELISAEEEASRTQEKLELYQSLREYDNEIFYGEWSIQLYGGGNEGTETESDEIYNRMITLQKDSITISGQTVTTQPVYFYNVRAYTKGLEEWDIFLEMDFVPDEIRDLFQKDYYIELMLDKTEHWDWEPEGMEKSIINNAIYYMLDENTMICFALDSKEIYILNRG
ncbi:MAG: hypothetical protein J1F42_14235 [Lachnospiraceae bacterium]|nr:hypothetical protein [Lachnospiraceae bacterium]